MNTLLVVLVSFWGLAQANERPIVISVVDTGYTRPKNHEMPNFCRSGHADFTTDIPTYGAIPDDKNGHGTHIVHVLQDRLKFLPKKSYCFVVFKYWDPKVSGKKAVKNTALSFEASRKIRADFVNYSSFGQEFSMEENNAVKNLLDDRIALVAAAGNNGARIISHGEKFHESSIRFIQNGVLLPKEKTVLAYPANYDGRVIVVGNLNMDLTINETSNRGTRVDTWEVGTDIEAGGVVMSGTSQATAVHTARLVIQKFQEKK